jgi:hypothetical protein
MAITDGQIEAITEHLCTQLRDKIWQADPAGGKPTIAKNLVLDPKDIRLTVITALKAAKLIP